jgi:DHA1 family tetracycline resistance protein-like MFS transporter
VSLPHRRALVFIAITVLLDVVGFGLILPVLPALLVELTGLGLSRVAVYGGWLAFVYAVMQFVCAPVLGNLSDRFGRRPVLLSAIGALGFDYLIMGFAPTLSWLFLGRFLAGIAGASFTPAYAYVADVSPPERRAQSFGVVSAAFGIGFVLGPALGGLLGELGPRAPFFAAAGLSLANLLYGFFVLPESLALERRRPFRWKRANPLGTLLAVRRHPLVLGMLAALFLWQLAHQVMPATWSFYTILRFGWTEAMVGASLACAGLTMAASQGGLVRVLVPRLGERRVVQLGMSIAALGYVGYATATAGWMMFAWLTTWLFGALVMPSTNGLMSRLVPADAQGELQGAVASLYGLSSVIGPPLMAQLFGWFSSAGAAPLHLPGAAFLAAAALTAASLAIFGRATAGLAAGRRHGVTTGEVPNADGGGAGAGSHC